MQYTEQEVRDMLLGMITPDFSRSDMARKAGATRSFVSQALNGDATLGSKIPAVLGLRKVVVYVRD